MFDVCYHVWTYVCVLGYLCMWSDVWRSMLGVCDVLCRLCRDSSLHFGTHWPTPLREGLREGSLPREVLLPNSSHFMAPATVLPSEEQI